MQKMILASLAGLLLLLGACTPEPKVAPRTNRWGKDYFPNLPVVTQDGKTLRFYDDVIKGKIVLIDFIYTRCPDICPLTTARLGQVQKKLGDRVGRDIFFYSISVDPTNDSPARLQEFARAFHTGPGWTFLTGRPEDIREIRARLGDRSQVLAEHRQEIVLGNDATGEWTRNSTFGDLDRLVMDIKAMDPKWRDQQRTPERDPASDTGYALGNEPGAAMFRRICAPCHSIGVGDQVGPDLRGVTTRRAHDWLVRFIIDPHEMLRRKDPIAVSLASSFPGAMMPRFGLTETDAQDLITYLDAQTKRLSLAQAPAHHAATP